MRKFRNASWASLGLILPASIAVMMAWAAITITITGSRNTQITPGVVGSTIATGNWVDNGGFKIAWTITFDDATSLWTYSYTLSDNTGGDLNKKLSHWLLQLSSVITEAGTGECTPTDTKICYDASLNGGLEFWTVVGPADQLESSGNDDLPATLYGIKMTPSGDFLGPYIFTFQSTHEPVWGHFYARDGNPSGDAITAWNTGLTNPLSYPTQGTTDFTPWIPRPDGDSIPLTTTTTSTSTTTTTLPLTTTTTDPGTNTTLPQTTTNPPSIPTANNWGMAALGLAFMGAMAWMLRVRRSLR